MSTITLSPAAPQMRLTRRGRVVVFVLGLMIAFAAGVLLAAGSVASGEAGAEVYEVVTVRPGDTLWDIASDASGGVSVQSMVSEIRDLNSLDSSMVVVGQELRVPTS